MPAPIWNPALNALVEEPGSPRWVFGERFTCTRVFQAGYTLCLNSAPMRGALGTGEMAGYSVAQATVERQRGSLGRLTIEYETLGQPVQGGQLPPTQETIELGQLEQAIEKHPRYASFTVENLEDIRTVVNTSKKNEENADAKTRISGNALAMELVEKLRRGNTYFSLWTPTVRIISFFWNAPSGLTMGGFREQPPSTQITPPVGEYVRGGDSLSFNGSLWQLTRTWIGAPQFDGDIYP